MLDRRAQKEHGIPGFVLMEHASRGVASLAARHVGTFGTIWVLCGPGNNGGDGYGAGRFLSAWGYHVKIFESRSGKGLPADARQERELALESCEFADLEGLEGALRGLDPSSESSLPTTCPGLVIDALFGVGLQRPLAGLYRRVIEALGAAPLPVLSVDVPSGLDGDSGQPLPVCVQADLTATMVAPKRGFECAGAWTGRVVAVDIGLPAALLRDLPRKG